MIHAALLSGLFIGVLSALPIVNVANCCCLWIVAGGALAAHLDRQHDPRPPTFARGAFAGFAAGMIGAFVWLIVSLSLSPVIDALQQRMADEMLRNARDLPPDVRVWFEGISNRASSPLRWVLGFLFHLVAGAVFATLGGGIASMFFDRNVPPALGGDTFVQPPPLPPS